MNRFLEDSKEAVSFQKRANAILAAKGPRNPNHAGCPNAIRIQLKKISAYLFMYTVIKGILVLL